MAIDVSSNPAHGSMAGAGAAAGAVGVADGGTGAGRWLGPASAVLQALAAPTLMVLDDLGLIRVGGAEATRFLQAQLTGNAELLAADRLQLDGYCSPKGRLIAVFHHWRDGDQHYLQLPRAILPALLRRLSMFVLRSRVELADVSAGWIALGAIGRDVAAAVAALVPAVELPHQPWQSSGDAARGVRIVRLPPAPRAPHRFLLLLTADAAAGVRARSAARIESAAGPGTIRWADQGAWWWSQIDAGIPMIFEPTQQRFVPQMINLEVLGGVDFRKGCYPGQEVVARSQYRGALRRRLLIAHSAAADPAYPGQDVVDAGEPPQAIGTVLMAATAPDGGVDLLLECAVDQAVAGRLHLAADPLSPRPAQPLQLRTVPYPITDPTA